MPALVRLLLWRLLARCGASRRRRLRRLVVENLLLRQQLSVYARKYKRPPLKDRDRRFWILACRWVWGWREAVVVIRAETVLRWHHKGWRAYWRWKSRSRKAGRRPIPALIRRLIRRMSPENPRRGQARVWAELLGLGGVVSPRTVAKYRKTPAGRVRPPRGGGIS